MINIDEMTYGDIKKLVALFGDKTEKQSGGFEHPELGNFVVVRTYAAGVHVGTLENYDFTTRHAVLKDTRRIWSWEGAFTLSAVALNGIKGGKLSEIIERNTISQVEEILTVTPEAMKSLLNFKAHKP